MLGDVGLVEIFAPAPEPLPPIEVAVGIPLGQRIAFARNRARLSQREVATALCVSPGAVAQWETVSKGIRTQRLSALASLLDVSIGWLVAGDVQSQPSEAAEPQAAE
jgi:transcriptional regulator with XRE-family HTH domain